MNEESQVRGCYNITFIYTNQETVSMLVAHQESKLLICLHLSAWLVNRDKDLIATTDTYHWPVRVHTQRLGKGLQAKQSESAHLRLGHTKAGSKQK